MIKSMEEILAMDEINKIFQYYVNLEKKDLLSIIAKAMEEIMPRCRAIDREHNGYICLAMMISSAFGADGKLTSEETEFLASLGINVEIIKSLLAADNLFDVIDTMIDCMDADMKSYAVSFMVALCALDGRIAPEENAFLRKLID